MKLKQINFVGHMNDAQKHRLMSIMCNSNNIHSNGIVYVHKMNKYFDNYNQMIKYKDMLSTELNIRLVNILFIYETR